MIKLVPPNTSARYFTLVAVLILEQMWWLRKEVVFKNSILDAKSILNRFDYSQEHIEKFKVLLESPSYS